LLKSPITETLLASGASKVKVTLQTGLLFTNCFLIAILLVFKNYKAKLQTNN
jgi:hypothetical protein